MAKLTIHTATYNRGYILGKAYESLKAQTCKNFEWIITDDGSTDNTKDLVETWLSNDNGFTIRYYKLDHVGIPRALNWGVNHAATEWFMMLDSDDYIVPDTVQLVLQWLDEIATCPGIGGIGFSRCFPNGEHMKPQIPIIDPKKGYVDATHVERRKYNLDMDMCEVHRTELFKKYPFQVYPGEKYAPEQLNFNQMALDGWKLRWRDKKLYICEYLPDGQTKDDKIVKNNPMGFAMMHNQNLILYSGLKKQLFHVLQMTALCFYAGHLEYLLKSNKPFLTFMAFPAGIVLGIRRKLQYRKFN